MERNNEPHVPIDLGAASKKTLGGRGQPFDLVKDIPASNGIVDD